MFLSHFDFFSPTRLNLGWISVDLPGCLVLMFLKVFFKNCCVLGKLFKYLVSLTDLIFCMLILSFPGSLGNFISLLVFFFWFPYILSYVNESFISVSCSTYWFHHLPFLFSLLKTEFIFSIIFGNTTQMLCKNVQ